MLPNAASEWGRNPSTHVRRQGGADHVAHAKEGEVYRLLFEGGGLLLRVPLLAHHGAVVELPCRPKDSLLVLCRMLCVFLASK